MEAEEDEDNEEREEEERVGRRRRLVGCDCRFSEFIGAEGPEERRDDSECPSSSSVVGLLPLPPPPQHELS